MRNPRHLLTLIVLLTVTSAYSRVRVDLVETEMELNRDGNATVMTRVWMTAPKATQFSIEMGLWDGTGIEGLTLCDEREQAFKRISSKRKLTSAGRYQLKRDGESARVSWCTAAPGQHVYVLRYTLSQLVKSGHGDDHFHVTLLRPTAPRAERINFIMRRETGKFTSDDVTVRTAGVTGRAVIENGMVLASSHKIVNDVFPMPNDDSLFVVAKFPQGYFEPTAEGTVSYSDAILHSGIHDYDVEDTKDSLKSLAAWGLLFGFIAVVVVLLYGGRKLWSRIRYLATLYPFRQWLRRRKLYSKSLWYRDLPMGGCLTQAHMALVETTSRLNPSQEGILGALILRLIHRGAASSERIVPVYGAAPQHVLRLLPWRSLPHPSPDEEVERQLYDMLLAASGADKILQTRELELYMRERTSEQPDAMSAIEQAGARDQISDTDLEQLYGLKKFLLEFTLIGDRGIDELPLWREYMVYAQLLGIADKVSKNFRVAYPDFLQVNDLSWRVARVPDVFSYGKK